MCSRSKHKVPFCLDGCPADQQTYQAREFRALQTSFLALADGCLTLPCLWTDGLVSSYKTVCTPEQSDYNLVFIPLFYELGTGAKSFWVATCDLTGRIVFLFVPSLNVVVFELNLERARALYGLLITLRPEKLPVSKDGRDSVAHVPIIALVDMVTNFGHQMINHLSGLDELVARRLDLVVDEVWLCGREFFGSTASLYQDISAPIRKFSSKDEVVNKIKERPHFVVRVGSNRFLGSTRARILQSASSNYATIARPDRYPLIAVTVRAENRVCDNLGELVLEIYNTLISQFPSIGFVLDGWVFREEELILKSSNATCLQRRHRPALEAEFELANSIFDGLPKTVIVRNLLGRSILESVSGLLDIDAYIAHAGTLQHKVAFLSLEKGFSARAR